MIPLELQREIQVNVATPKDPVTGTLVKNELITDPGSPHFTRHVVIDISDTPMEGNFQAGQAFGVIPEWEHFTEYNKVKIHSDDHKLRLYSIASPSDGENGNGQYLSTTVKRVFDEHWDTEETFLGVCSNYLCDLDPGDTCQVTGPTGKHLLLPDRENRNDYKYVFLATGTGIAPYRGMAMELLNQGITQDIFLVLGVPYHTDVLYEDLFETLEKEHENFHFQRAISRQQTTSNGEKMYVQNRLLEQEEIYRSLFQDEDTLVYICGLDGMEIGIYRSMLLLGGEDFLANVDDSVNPDELDPRDEYFQSLQPNKDRTLVEVY